MTENDVKAVEKLWMGSPRERAQLGAQCPEDEVEQEAA
jgi:hypothetical protein